MTSRPTLQEASRDALAVQNACNVSGVVLAFGRAMSAVMDDCCKPGGGGPVAARHHPITVLFMDKLNDMCGRNIKQIDYCEAYEKCSKMAGETVEV